MSAAQRNGGDGGGPSRFYKLVGAVVVAVAIAAALVPLWMSGGSEKETQVVEVQPESLRDNGTQRSRAETPAQPAEPERSEDGGGEKWWQAQDQGDAGAPSAQTAPNEEPASQTPSEPSPRSASSSQAPAPSASGASAPGEEGGQASAGAPSGTPAEAETGNGPEGGSGSATEEQEAKAAGPYWTVMVGSFRNPDNARKLQDQLREQGFETQVVTRMIKGSEWNRVYAGSKSSREEAAKILPRLREAGYKDLLVLKAE